MTKYSVAIKIIINDDTIQEIINPAVNVCEGRKVILNRNPGNHGDTFDFATTAAESDQHTKIREKFPDIDEKFDPKPVSQRSGMKIKKHQSRNKLRKSPSKEPAVQPAAPEASVPIPPLPLPPLEPQGSQTANEKLLIDKNQSNCTPLSMGDASVEKPSVSSHLNSVENLRLSIQQRLTKGNKSHPRKEAFIAMPTNFESTVHNFDMSKVISFQGKDPQSSTSISHQQSNNPGPQISSADGQKSHSPRTVVISPPLELMHVTQAGSIYYTDVVKKGVLQLFERSISQVVLLVQQKNDELDLGVPPKHAFKVTKSHGTLDFELTEFPPKKNLQGSKRKLWHESLSSDMNAFKRKLQPETLSYDPCNVQYVFSKAPSSTTSKANVAFISEELSSVSDARAQNISIKDKRHLRTAEETVKISANKAVHSDTKNQTSLPQSNATNSASVATAPACGEQKSDFHPKKSKRSVHSSTISQPVTKHFQNLNSAVEPQAVTTNTQILKCPTASKTATGPEQTSEPPIETQSTRTVSPSSPTTFQATDAVQSHNFKKITSFKKITNVSQPLPSSGTISAIAETSKPAYVVERVLLPASTDVSKPSAHGTVSCAPATLTDNSCYIQHARVSSLEAENSKSNPKTPVSSYPVTDMTCSKSSMGESSQERETIQSALRTSDIQQVSLTRFSELHVTVTKGGTVPSDVADNNVTSTNSFDSPLHQWTKSDVARWLYFHKLGRYVSEFLEMDGPCMVEMVHCLNASPGILQTYLKELGFSLYENCKLLSLLRGFSKQVGVNSV